MDWGKGLSSFQLFLISVSAFPLGRRNIFLNHILPFSLQRAYLSRFENHWTSPPKWLNYLHGLNTARIID